jgi:hypothetical protein
MIVTWSDLSPHRGLVKLDQVTAGVVEYCNDSRSDIGWLALKFHAETF